jgi:hypothetical protein
VLIGVAVAGGTIWAVMAFKRRNRAASPPGGDDAPGGGEQEPPAPAVGP